MKFMDNYWQELSFDKINLADSQVFGWYNLPQPRSTYVWGSGVWMTNFTRLALDCTEAADADINFPDYEGIILAFNQDLDCCAYGGSFPNLNRDGVTKTYGITWMLTWGWANANVMGHEMGHGFGLPHSTGPYGPTSGSRWDIMSSGYNCQPPDPSFGCVGVHTISFHKYLLGWIPDHRRYLATAAPDQSVYIEPLEQFGGNYGYLIAQIPIGGSSTNFYTIEARKWIGFDVGLPGEAIIIHEVDTTRDRPAWVVDVDVIPNSDPNDEGAMWTTGEIFRDTANNISVAIAEESANGYRIIINPTNQPPKANDQSVTINKNTPARIALTASDPDGGDALTYSIVTNPSEGSLSSFNPSTGIVRYTPDRNYVGLDSFTFKVIDSTGSDSNTATVTIVVNGDDYPETWINSVRTPDGTDIPNGGSTSSKVVTVDFQGTVSGPGSHIDLKLDNRKWVPVASPKTIPGLSVGKHTIYLRAVDQDGNVDPTPAKWTFTVKKDKGGGYPETWINWVRATPRGVNIANGGSTSSSTVIVDFQGTVSGRGSHIDLKIDNGRYKPVASPHTITGLSVGTHTIYLRAIDQDGNVDRQPAKWTFTVKNNDDYPETWINWVRATPGGKNIPNGGTTTSTSVVVDFQGTVSGRGSHIDLKIDSGSYVPVASPHTITGLSDGPHTIYLKAVDKDGKADPSPAKWRFTVINDNDN